MPLIVVPHGGPHASFATDYMHPYAWLAAACGWAVLLVNYRGSMGCGEAATSSLPGHIGDHDVSDVHVATLTALQLGGNSSSSGGVVTVDVLGQASLPVRLDADRVVVAGGSHGGFLAAHMIGAHPDVFNAAVLRNPVINVAAMLTATDIPDWCVRERAAEVCVPSVLVDAPPRVAFPALIFFRCWVEGMGVGAYGPYSTPTASSSPDPTAPGGAPQATAQAVSTGVPTAEAVARMYAASPIAHVAAGRVTAPTLILLGLKDKRVPPSQGIEYFHALKGAGLATRLAQQRCGGSAPAAVGWCDTGICAGGCVGAR